MDREQVIALMKSSRSEQEWNDNCDKVKKAYQGYPDWWYSTIMISGVFNETRKNW